jgi:hypothetical protein
LEFVEGAEAEAPIRRLGFDRTISIHDVAVAAEPMGAQNLRIVLPN